MQTKEIYVYTNIHLRGTHLSYTIYIINKEDKQQIILSVIHINGI